MADKNIKLIIEAVLKDKGFQKGVKGMGTQMKKTSIIAGGFSKVLGALGLAGGIYALVGVMKSAIKTQMEFEQSVANVASVSGDSNKAIAELARRMGKDTVFSAKEAADSMYFLASSGMKVSQMSEVLAPTLDLAAAAQMGIAEATDIVVNNLKVFATEGIKAQEVVDTMAQTVRSSNTNMQQMGEAVKYAGSEMSLAGVKFKDIALTIGAMADMGHKGSEAGAKLRMVYARLGGDIAPVTKALKKYTNALTGNKITQKDITKLLPTPIKLFKMLKDANISNADATKIFGVRNKAVFKLIKDGLPSVEKLRKALKDTGGVAKEMAEKQLDTLQGQLKMLKAAYDEIVLSMMGSSGMAAGLKEVTKELVNQTRTIGDWINSAAGIQIIEIAIKALGVAFKLVYATAIQPVFEFMFVLIKASVEAFIGLGKTISLVFKGEWKKAVIEANSALDDMKNTAVNSVKRIGNTWKGMGKDLAYMWKATTKDYTKEADDRVSAGAKETEVLGKGYKKGTKEFKKAEKEKTRIARKESKKRKKLVNEYYDYVLNDIAKRYNASLKHFKEIEKHINISYKEYVKIQKKKGESFLNLTEYATNIHKQSQKERNKLNKEALEKYGLTLEKMKEMTAAEAERYKEIQIEKKEFDDEYIAKKKEYEEAAEIQRMNYLGYKMETEMIAETQRYERLKEMAIKYNKDIEELEDTHNMKMAAIAMNHFKEKSDMFIGSAISICRSLIKINKARLDGIDKDDKKARDRVIEELNRLWEWQRGLAMSQAGIKAAAAVLTTMASVPYPFNIPLAVLQGAAGAAQIAAMASEKKPEYAKGIEQVPETGMAMVHAGERIIPASMNVPNIDNSDFMEAAMAGIPIIRSGSGSNTTNNDNANNSRSITIQNVTLPNVTNTKEMLLEMQEIADSMGTSLLNV